MSLLQQPLMGGSSVIPPDKVTVATLGLWLDMSDLSTLWKTRNGIDPLIGTEGERILSYTDKSPNGYIIDAVGASSGSFYRIAHANGLPAAEFTDTGGPAEQTNVSPVEGSFSFQHVFAVIEAAGAGQEVGAFALVAGGGGTSQSGKRTGTTIEDIDPYSVSGNGDLTWTGAIFDQPIAYEVTYDLAGDAGSLRCDGVVRDTHTGNFSSPKALTDIHIGGSESFNTDCHIMEIAVYNGEVTGVELDGLRQYFSRWSVTF